MNETREAVIAAANARYGGRPICLDKIEEAMTADTLEDAVGILIMDTQYWDGEW
jgi:hypothetical protein